jgi:hypothetical protein
MDDNPAYITFTRKSGKTIYVGRSGDTLYTIKTEKQIDPYTIEYTGFMSLQGGDSIGYGCWNDTSVTFTVARHKKNNKLTLCVGTCGGLVPMGFVRP